MRRILLALLLAILPLSVFAQTSVLPCYRVTGGCTDISATNPMPVTGTISSSGTVTGTGAAGTAATGVLTVQGIAAMTPLLSTLSGTNNIATVTTLTGITNTVVTQELGASFNNITTNADTNVKGTPGTLVGFSVNTVGITSSVKFFNDADGTCSTALIGTFSTLAQGYVMIPAAATIGICAQTAGGTPADITVYFR